MSRENNKDYLNLGTPLTAEEYNEVLLDEFELQGADALTRQMNDQIYYDALAKGINPADLPFYSHIPESMPELGQGQITPYAGAAGQIAALGGGGDDSVTLGPISGRAYNVSPEAPDTRFIPPIVWELYDGRNDSPMKRQAYDGVYDEAIRKGVAPADLPPKDTTEEAELPDNIQPGGTLHQPRSQVVQPTGPLGLPYTQSYTGPLPESEYQLGLQEGLYNYPNISGQLPAGVSAQYPYIQSLAPPARPLRMHEVVGAGGPEMETWTSSSGEVVQRPIGTKLTPSKDISEDLASRGPHAAYDTYQYGPTDPKVEAEIPQLRAGRSSGGYFPGGPPGVQRIIDQVNATQVPGQDGQLTDFPPTTIQGMLNKANLRTDPNKSLLDQFLVPSRSSTISTEADKSSEEYFNDLEKNKDAINTSIIPPDDAPDFTLLGNAPYDISAINQLASKTEPFSYDQLLEMGFLKLPPAAKPEIELDLPAYNYDPNGESLSPGITNQVKMQKEVNDATKEVERLQKERNEPKGKLAHLFDLLGDQSFQRLAGTALVAALGGSDRGIDVSEFNRLQDQATTFGLERKKLEDEAEFREREAKVKLAELKQDQEQHVQELMGTFMQQSIDNRTQPPAFNDAIQSMFPNMTTTRKEELAKTYKGMFHNKYEEVDRSLLIPQNLQKHFADEVGLENLNFKPKVWRTTAEITAERKELAKLSMEEELAREKRIDRMTSELRGKVREHIKREMAEHNDPIKAVAGISYEAMFPLYSRSVLGDQWYVNESNKEFRQDINEGQFADILQNTLNDFDDIRIKKQLQIAELVSREADAAYRNSETLKNKLELEGSNPLSRLKSPELKTEMIETMDILNDVNKVRLMVDEIWTEARNLSDNDELTRKEAMEKVVGYYNNPFEMAERVPWMEQLIKGTAYSFGGKDASLNMYAALATIHNKLLKKRSGAAVTQTEFDRAMNELPHKLDNPVQFLFKLDNLAATLENHWKTVVLYSEGATEHQAEQAWNFLMTKDYISGHTQKWLKLDKKFYKDPDIRYRQVMPDGAKEGNAGRSLRTQSSVTQQSADAQAKSLLEASDLLVQ